MKLACGLHNLDAAARRGAVPGGPRGGCVLTVGNYDGVHLGHQRMIGVVKERAAELRCESTVMVFEPSSKEFIDPAGAPPRLTRWREKVRALADLRIDRLVTLRFDDAMRAMSPQSFVQRLMVDSLNVRHVVVGDDFRYGARAQGTIDSLRQAGLERGFGVEQVPPFVVDGVRVSSTAVRERLEKGDCDGAARLLGRRYRMMGRVVRGRALGRTLGFPTANVRLMRRRRRCGGFWRCGCLASRMDRSTGWRAWAPVPTVDGVEPLLEVHVFDFTATCTAVPIEVEFVAKLRDEVSFDSLDAIVVQMRIDAARSARSCSLR